MGIPALFALLVLVSAQKGTLIALVEVCRHGARAPISPYIWDTGSWPMGLGQLTPAGMRQHYLNGVQFRNKYISQLGLLPAQYNAAELYVRTTDVNRTFMSAQSQLMGWFPTGPSLLQSQVATAVPPLNLSPTVQQLQKTMGLPALLDAYQSVPIHNVLYSEDTVLLPYDPSVCSVVNTIVNYVRGNATYKSIVNDYKANWQANVSAVLSPNGKLLEYEDAAWCADNLISDKFHGFGLPTGVTDDMFTYLSRSMSYCNSYFFSDPLGVKLGASEFFKALGDFFQTLNNERTSTPKFMLYSAHDTTVAGFLTALGAFNATEDPNPPFASTLMFELWADSVSANVTVIYNDEVLQIPDECGGLPSCQLTSFLNYLSRYELPYFAQACNGSAGGLKLEGFKTNPFLSKRRT